MSIQLNFILKAWIWGNPLGMSTLLEPKPYIRFKADVLILSQKLLC